MESSDDSEITETTGKESRSRLDRTGIESNSFYGDWLDLGPVDQIPLRGARTVPVAGGEEIAVFRTGDNRIYALVNRCPHKGGPLSQGIVHGDKVACPLHNWNISLATGQAQGADSGCTPTIPVRLVSGRIQISREAVIGRAAA